MAKSIDKAGIYNVDVTISQGCTIEFTPINGVTISPQSGGSQRYVFTVSDGANGTVVTKVNGNTCDDYSIVVNTGPGCTCNDLTTTPHAAPATIAQGQNFTIISYNSPNDCLDVITAETSVDWFSIDSYAGGSVVGHVTKDNDGPGTKAGTVRLTIKIKDGETCTTPVSVSISQNSPTCLQDSCTCYVVGSVTYPSSSSTQATVSWPYSAITWTTASTCDITSAKTSEGTSSTTVTYPEATCSKYTQSGTITWANHKACGNKSCSNNNVTLSWSVNQGRPAGCDCNCNDITASTNSISWTVNDDTHKPVAITFGTCINIGNIELTGTDKNHFDFSTASTATNEITVNVWPIETGLTDSKSASLSIPYGTGGTSTNCGTKSVSLSHDGSGCNCGDLSLVFNNKTSHFPSIYWESTETDNKTITFSIAPGKESCFDYSAINMRATLEGSDGDKFTLDTSRITSGEVKIKPNGPNDDTSRNLQAEIHFKYDLNSSSCDGVNVAYLTQDKAACDCKNITDSPCILSTVPLTAGTYTIANANTEGCGYFTGETSAYEDLGITTINYGLDGSISVVATTITNEASGDIDMRFVNTTSGKECPATVTFRRTSNYINCDVINSMTFVDENASHTSGNKSIAHISYTNPVGDRGFRQLYGDGIISFSTETTWIDISTLDVDLDHTNVFLDIDVELNDSGDPRTGHLTMTLDAEKLKKEYGVCDCEYHSDIEFTQKGNPAYSCDCPQAEGEVEEIKNIPAYGIDSDTNYDEPFPWIKDSCIDSTATYRYVVLDSDGTTELTNCYQQFVSFTGNDWLQVKLKYDSSTGHPDESRLMIYKKVAPNTRQEERNYTITIKYFLKDKECKVRIKYVQNAAETVTCEVLSNSIDEWGENYAGDATGDTFTFADFDNTLMEGVRLSGAVDSECKCYVNNVLVPDCHCEWITKIEPNGKYVRATVTSNKSSEGDGSSYPRKAENVKLFFIDSNGERLKIGGSECPEIPVTVYQKGYGGDCPACSDVDARTFITHDYTGYGDIAGGCKLYPQQQDSEYVPAFYGSGSSTPRVLFKCTVPKCQITDGSTTTYMKCFDVSASTSHHDDFVQSGGNDILYAEHESSTSSSDTYLIKGALKELTDKDYSSILISLNLIRLGLPDSPCESNSHEAHIKNLKTGTSCPTDN